MPLKITAQVISKVKKNDEFSESDCEFTQITDGSEKKLLMSFGNVSIKIRRSDLEKALRIL